MSLFDQARRFLVSRIEVPTAQDPDDARRRKLLNIILAGILVASLFTLIASIAGLIFGISSILDPGAQQLLLSGVFLVTATLIFYFLNRNQGVPGWLTGGSFLIFLMVLLAFTDTPAELASGRSLFIFALPIIMSSMLLNPLASFVFVIITIFEITILADIGGVAANTVAMVSYSIVALISWLSSRSLEDALKELRRTNTNLDRLVAQRTQALVESLARERVESGRNQAILESIADGVIVFDTHGKALMANPAISRLLGWPLERITSTSMDDLAHAEELSPGSRAAVGKMLSGVQEATPGLRMEWGKKVLSASIADVHDTSGDNIGAVAVFRDFTREAEIERMKSAFVAMVSHELRTPLNAILGFAEMLKESVYGPINPKQTESAGRILTNTQRLLGIVNDLLDQAQIEAGKLTVQSQPFRPAELITNVHGVMDKMAADKGLMLTSQIDSNVPEMLTGDPQRLQQVLVNLATNAVKFTDHGSIHIRISTLGDKQWTIEVRDTGLGIARDSLPHIFETFHQVENSTTRLQRGVGLGLSIVRQLVQLMGGAITAQSELGVGSVFTVSLPLVSAQEVRA